MKRRVFKNFDVEDAKNGAKVITRNGHYVRILSYDIKNEYSPILAAILEDDGHERVMQYNEHGEPNEADEEGYFLHIVKEEEIESEDEKMLDNIQGCLNFFFDKCDYDEKCISKEDIFNWIKNKKEGLSRSECIEMWIARNNTKIDGEVNDLFLYGEEPYRKDKYFITGKAYDGEIILNKVRKNRNLFPEINFQNSPKRVKVNLELISDEDEESN